LRVSLLDLLLAFEMNVLREKDELRIEAREIGSQVERIEAERF
jgi:hypothetical protein